MCDFAKSKLPVTMCFAGPDRPDLGRGANMQTEGICVQKRANPMRLYKRVGLKGSAKLLRLGRLYEMLWVQRRPTEAEHSVCLPKYTHPASQAGSANINRSFLSAQSLTLF